MYHMKRLPGDDEDEAYLNESDDDEEESATESAAQPRDKEEGFLSCFLCLPLCVCVWVVCFWRSCVVP